MAELTESKIIRDVIHVEPDVHGDDRGRFIETYRRSWFPLGREMVQANRSDKAQGAVVGLHYHLHQADYWYSTRGRSRVVLYDLRIGSATQGALELIDLGLRRLAGAGRVIARPIEILGRGHQLGQPVAEPLAWSSTWPSTNRASKSWSAVSFREFFSCSIRQVTSRRSATRLVCCSAVLAAEIRAAWRRASRVTESNKRTSAPIVQMSTARNGKSDRRGAARRPRRVFNHVSFMPP